MHANPYMPVPAVLERVIDETPTIKTFVIRPELPIPFEAGQFVELCIPGVGEAPFTPSSSPSITETMEITIMAVGRVTDLLHRMQPGDALAVRGPLGVGYPLVSLRGRHVIAIGGGCGVGPLRALLFAMFEELDSFPRISVRFGAHSPDDIVFRDAASQRWQEDDRVDVMISVDEASPSWSGPVGVVTEILDEEHLQFDPANSVAVLCGPPAMMKFATQKLCERGMAPHDIYVSLERNMSCGCGKCGHCRLGPYYVCADGPVFSLAQVMALQEAWE